jgi:hypothetical protein
MEGSAVNDGSGIDVIVVRRHWNDWRSATYRRTDVSELHWTGVSGGVRVPLPAPFVHGYVLCDGMISGELAHSCAHGPPPHRISVCVLKIDNPKLWRDIEREIGPRPGTKKRAAWEERARNEIAKGSDDSI